MGLHKEARLKLDSGECNAEAQSSTVEKEEILKLEDIITRGNRICVAWHSLTPGSTHSNTSTGSFLLGANHHHIIKYFLPDSNLTWGEMTSRDVTL